MPLFGRHDTVGMKDVHDEVLRMSGQLKVIIERDADHEARIRILERFRYAFPIAALASISSVLLTIWQTVGNK